MLAFAAAVVLMLVNVGSGVIALGWAYEHGNASRALAYGIPYVASSVAMALLSYRALAAMMGS